MIADKSDREKPDLEKLKNELAYLHTMTGLGGYERNQHIRKAFKLIIDHVTPCFMKIMIFYHRHGKQPSPDKVMKL